MEACSGVGYINEEEEDYDELAATAAVVDQMPPGFRFHPTDSEIIDYYLLKKVMDRWFQAVAVGEIDLNKCEPWDLPQKAKTGEKERFFFFEKETKYPSGMRTNRATPSGYWKATGKDKGIYNAKKRVIGMKKTLVFYRGRAPKGEKMNWVLHEYRLHGDYSAYNLSAHAKEKWVVCKVFHKKNQVMSTNPADVDGYLLDSPAPVLLPPLTDYSEKPSSIHQFKASTLMLNNNTLQEIQHNNLLFPQLMMNNSYNLQQYSAPQMLHLNYLTPSPSVVVYQHQDTSTNGADRIYIGGKEERNGRESKRSICDEEVEVEGLGFSPNISDLDSLYTQLTKPNVHG